MSRAAFNALLKVLEEPPPATRFILLTTEARAIPATVASRCMPFTFRPVPAAAIAARLAEICQAEGIEAEPALLELLAERAGGGVRNAVVALEQAWRSGITTRTAWGWLTGDADYAPGLVAAMVTRDLREVFARLDEVLTRTGDFAAIGASLAACLRDALVTGAGGDISARGEALEQRRAIAARVTPEQLIAALKVMWDLRVKVRTDPRSDLELAVVMVTELLAGPRKIMPAAIASGDPASSSNGHAGTGSLSPEQIRQSVASWASKS
jgi:DNA polymerase-3 subunit gamma/tau